MKCVEGKNIHKTFSLSLCSYAKLQWNSHIIQNIHIIEESNEC
jgi:hypothetical protein